MHATQCFYTLIDPLESYMLDDMVLKCSTGACSFQGGQSESSSIVRPASAQGALQHQQHGIIGRAGRQQMQRGSRTHHQHCRWPSSRFSRLRSVLTAIQQPVLSSASSCVGSQVASPMIKRRSSAASRPSLYCCRALLGSTPGNKALVP